MGVRFVLHGGKMLHQTTLSNSSRKTHVSGGDYNAKCSNAAGILPERCRDVCTNVK
jgi:hypothetical protein